MPDPEQQDVPEPTPLITDLRTGTEVDPKVVAHHAAFLQGAPYDSPYPEPPPAYEGDQSENERKGNFV
jgi:hypothetical protein